MSENYESAFAEEAQEEAIMSNSALRSRSEQSTSKKSNTHAEVTEAEDLQSETSPLLASEDNIRQRQPYQRAGKSYDRAINEPWTGAHGQGNLPWYKTPSILFLLPGFFPFCVAIGGILVPKTYLINDIICRDYFASKASADPTFHSLPIIWGGENLQCDAPEVSALVAYFNMYTDLISGFPAALVAPFLGALSDRIGRKKVIIFGSLGAMVSEVITIIIGRNAQTASVYWLLLGALADGLCGSFTTALALVFAYASDCTPPKKRAVAFGYFHGTLFSGIALGPLIAGLLIKATGNILVPFYLAVACHIFFILYTTLVVPESLSKERQLIAREKYAKQKLDAADQSWGKTIKNYNIFEALWVLRPTGPGSSPALRRNMLFIAAIDTMMFGVAMGAMRVILIYAKVRFHWNPVDASFFSSVCNIFRVSGLLIFLPLVTKIFRGRSQDRFQGQADGHRGSDKLDIGIIRTAVVFDLLGYLGYALTPNGSIMVLSGIVAAVGGIGSPTLQSSLTKHIPASMTGQVLGASGLLHAMSRVVAPVIFNIIYARTVTWFPGFVFLCLASCFVVMIGMSWFLKPNVYLHDETSVEQETEQVQTEAVPT